MKILLKAMAIFVLAFIYSKIIYIWTWLDGFFESKFFWGTYGVLARFFNIQSVEEGDFMILLVILFVSLIAAILTVWFLSRFMLDPLYRRHGIA